MAVVEVFKISMLVLNTVKTTVKWKKGKGQLKH